MRNVEDAGCAGYTQAAAADAVAELFGYVRAVLAAIAAVGLAVAALGVASALLTAVSERTVEIGVLKAIGADDATVGRLFLAEAALLGLVGATAGIALGWIGAMVASLIVERVTGFGLLLRVGIELVATAVGVALAVSLGGSPRAALRASRPRRRCAADSGLRSLSVSARGCPDRLTLLARGAD